MKRQDETVDRTWDGLDTGMISVIWNSDEPGDCYVTVPIAEEPGEVLAVFQDGSTTRWRPADARPDRIPPRWREDQGGRWTARA